MKLEGEIHNLPSYPKIFIFAFLLTLSFGYYKGVIFVKHTTEFTPHWIEENYNGNQTEEVITEDDWENDEWGRENFAPLKYKKSEQEIISIVHAHVISFSLIFLLLGAIVINKSVKIKKILKLKINKLFPHFQSMS